MATGARLRGGLGQEPTAGVSALPQPIVVFWRFAAVEFAHPRNALELRALFVQVLGLHELSAGQKWIVAFDVGLFARRIGENANVVAVVLRRAQSTITNLGPAAL